jgi:hypothetical protein
MNRFLLPARKGRMDLHIVILKYSKRKGNQSIISRQLFAAFQSDGNSRVAIVHAGDYRVVYDLAGFQKGIGFLLDEGLKATLIDGEKNVITETSRFGSVGEVISLKTLGI